MWLFLDPFPVRKCDALRWKILSMFRKNEWLFSFRDVDNTQSGRTWCNGEMINYVVGLWHSKLSHCQGALFKMWLLCCLSHSLLRSPGKKWNVAHVWGSRPPSWDTCMDFQIPGICLTQLRPLRRVRPPKELLLCPSLPSHSAFLQYTPFWRGQGPFKKWLSIEWS